MTSQVSAKDKFITKLEGEKKAGEQSSRAKCFWTEVIQVCLSRVSL